MTGMMLLCLVPALLAGSFFVLCLVFLGWVVLVAVDVLKGER